MRGVKPVLFVLLVTACGSSSPTTPPGGPDAYVDPHVDASFPIDAPPIVPTTNIQVIVEPNGNKGQEVVTAIAAATKSVEMTMYQIDDDDVTNALIARQKAGVTVRCVLDVANQSWNMDAYTKLTAAGVGVQWSATTFTYTHEKTIVIDDKVAWIMTMNMNNSSPVQNREYLAIDQDPADVAEAKAVFEADYAKTGITPTGDLVVANNNARPALYDLIGTATTTLDIEGEEFSDSQQKGIVVGVNQALARGVKVRIIVAKDSSPLAAETQAINTVKGNGAQVVVSGPTSGNGSASNPYIHAKAILVDCTGTQCTRGFLGSENFSAGSLGYNRELGVIIGAPAELAKIKTAIDADFAHGVAQ